MPRICVRLVILASILMSFAAFPKDAMAFPEPLIATNAWEYRFKYEPMKAIAIEKPDGTYEWFWYVIYQCENRTGDTRLFAPEFSIATNQGEIITANSKIPPAVFVAIKRRSRNELLEPPLSVIGRFLPGRDNMKESVIIWRAPKNISRMKLFIGGLSGETQRLTAGRSLLVFNKRKGEVTYNGQLIKESQRRSLPQGTGRKLRRADLHLDDLKEINGQKTIELPNGVEVDVKSEGDGWSITYEDEEHKLVIKQKKEGYDLTLRKQLLIEYDLPGRSPTPRDRQVIEVDKSWVIR